MKKLIPILFSLVVSTYGWTQGCVAIRNVAGVSPDLLFKNIQPNDKWLMNLTNRYFEASSTYVGEKFITDSLVTNKIYTLNISAIRLLDKGWSIAVSLPLSANSRKNSRDHSGSLQMPKHTTRAFGIGDLRVSVYKWLMNPSAYKKWNIQAGLGIKLPTGDYKYQDYFYRKEDSTVLAPVDQAIQLGDGGTGLIGELSGFYTLTNSINLFASGYYLMNPREQNGTSNLKGRNPTPTEIANNTTVMSVPDQYSFRFGGNFQVQKFSLTAAVHYEKLPVNDLVGGNKGFRRAATIISAEPGIAYAMNKALAYFYLGVPFERDIVQNHQNNMTPAGFADYVYYFGVQFKL